MAYKHKTNRRYNGAARLQRTYEIITAHTDSVEVGGRFEIGPVRAAYQREFGSSFTAFTRVTNELQASGKIRREGWGTYTRLT